MAAGTKPEEVKDKDVRWFGVIMLVALGLIALYLYRKAVKAGDAPGSAPLVLACVGAVVCAAALAAPRFMRPVYAGWMFVGRAMGTVVNAVVLAVVFYAVVTPMGIVMRLAGRDPLKRAFESDATSYWQEREPHPEKERYERQF